jgi:hypothetical protein
MVGGEKRLREMAGQTPSEETEAQRRKRNELIGEMVFGGKPIKAVATEAAATLITKAIEYFEDHVKTHSPGKPQTLKRYRRALGCTSFKTNSAKNCPAALIHQGRSLSNIRQRDRDMLVNSLPNENGMLVALPPFVRDRLRPSLNRVRLEAGGTLYDISSTSDHAWFITSGIVSFCDCF